MLVAASSPSTARLLLRCATRTVALAVALFLLCQVPWSMLGSGLWRALSAVAEQAFWHPWAYFGGVVLLGSFGTCLHAHLTQFQASHRAAVARGARGLMILAGVGLVAGLGVCAAADTPIEDGSLARFERQADRMNTRYHQEVALERSRDPYTPKAWLGVFDEELQDHSLNPPLEWGPPKGGTRVFVAADGSTVWVETHLKQTECTQIRGPLHGFVPVWENGRPVQGALACDAVFDNTIHWAFALTPTAEDLQERLGWAMRAEQRVAIETCEQAAEQRRDRAAWNACAARWTGRRAWTD